MDSQTTVTTLLDAVQAGDFKKVKSLLADDFQFSGPVSEPLKGGRWIGLSANLKTAFPNLDYHFAVVGADRNVVHISAQLTGTHSGNLDLSSRDMGHFPGTGKSFSAKQERGDVTVESGKVVSMKMQPTEGAGLMAILTQLGIAVPTE